MKLLPIYIIFIFLFVPLISIGQEKKPTVALVLSGGGAKGIAHIPLLQKLDSLGIVPDMVLGTSMGSIVGGLYAMGYSGDSIANIAKDADWDELLGGKISLSKVSVEEKSEFKRYLIDLDLKKGKPKVNSSLLNDQSLREFLSTLTYPVHNIRDFDKLSIPFRAIATDLVNGKEVIMSEGSLALAMRASMSIPSVFRPVKYNGTLLVDGGVLNNFPTDIAKTMGADIIIGSDVGGGMAPIEKLDNITTILFQTGMLSSNLKNPQNKKNCDILLDHVPYLTLSTGDFTKGNEILEEGKIATDKNLDALISLAEQLKGFDKRIHQLPVIKKEFIIDTISYTGISKDNLELVIDRANIKTNTPYTFQDIVEGINKAMGTNLFSQITTSNFVEKDDKTRLQINGYEHSRNQLKGALHYDTYRGVGIIINYTGRNILGESSRLIASLDIAEQPRFRVAYQKIFGEDKSWWWRSEVYGEELKQKVFIDGNYANDMRSRMLLVDNEVNKNINSLGSYVGLGLNYKNTYIRPKINPEFNDSYIDLNHYKFNNIEIYGQYIKNSLNDVYYATTGTYIQATIGRSLLNDLDLTYYNKVKPDVKGKTNDYTKTIFNFESRFQIKKKITGIVGGTSSFIFEDQLKGDEESFTKYGYASKYFIGGNLLIPNKNSFLFPGLYEGELNASQFLKVNLAVQFTPVNKVYFTPNFFIGSVGFGTFKDYIKDAFTPDSEWQNHIETSLVMSAGATISYHSLLGPINLNASWINDINKVRVLFSIGFVFNPSIR